jgi:hypothetical protein
MLLVVIVWLEVDRLDVDNEDVDELEADCELEDDDEADAELVVIV